MNKFPSSSNLKMATKSSTSSTSEQFLSHLSKLGSKIPTHLKPEHLDYALKTEGGRTLVDLIMKEVGGDNVLSMEEMGSFKAHEKNGTALYGKHLENAVRTKKALYKGKSLEAKEEGRIIQQLDDQIAKEKADLEQMERMMEVLENIGTSKSEYGMAKSGMTLQEELDVLKVQIQAAERTLDKEQEEMKKMESKLLESFNDVNHRLLYWDWKTFIQKEDDFHSEVEQVIKDNIPLLIIATEVDNVETEAEKTQFQQACRHYEAEFDRLRHSIIYEKTREYQVSLKLAEAKAALSFLEEVKDQLSTGSNNSRNISISQPPSDKEIERRLGTLESALERDRSQSLLQIKQAALVQTDGRLSSIVDNANRANKRLGDFIRGVFNILVSQKVRIDLAKHFIRKEMLNYSVVEEKIMEYRKQLEKCHNPTNDDMSTVFFSPEERILVDLALNEVSTSHFVYASSSDTDHVQTLPIETMESILSNARESLAKNKLQFDQFLEETIVPARTLLEEIESFNSDKELLRTMQEQSEDAIAEIITAKQYRMKQMELALG